MAKCNLGVFYGKQIKKFEHSGKKAVDIIFFTGYVAWLDNWMAD